MRILNDDNIVLETPSAPYRCRCCDWIETGDPWSESIDQHIQSAHNLIYTEREQDDGFTVIEWGMKQRVVR